MSKYSRSAAAPAGRKRSRGGSAAGSEAAAAKHSRSGSPAAEGGPGGSSTGYAGVTHHSRTGRYEASLERGHLAAQHVLMVQE